MDPIHTAFVQGLGHITPSQDHTPSLACNIIVEAAGGSTEVPVGGQEPSQCGSHGVAQALMTARGDLPSQREARGGIKHFRDVVDKLFYANEVFQLPVFANFKVNT